MIKLWNKYDSWLNDKLPNGFNHAIHALKIILIVLVLFGFYGALVAYVISILLFYVLEVKQRMDTQYIPFKHALKFWQWQRSQIEDVICLKISTFK